MIHWGLILICWALIAATLIGLAFRVGINEL